MELAPRLEKMLVAIWFLGNRRVGLNPVALS